MCTSGGSQPIAIIHFRRSTPTPDLHLESAVPAARRKVRNLGGSAFKLRFRVTVVIWKLVWAIMGFKISKGKVLGIETWNEMEIHDWNQHPIDIDIDMLAPILLEVAWALSQHLVAPPKSMLILQHLKHQLQKVRFKVYMYGNLIVIHLYLHTIYDYI